MSIISAQQMKQQAGCHIAPSAVATRPFLISTWTKQQERLLDGTLHLGLFLSFLWSRTITWMAALEMAESVG